MKGIWNIHYSKVFRRKCFSYLSKSIFTVQQLVRLVRFINGPPKSESFQYLKYLMQIFLSELEIRPLCTAAGKLFQACLFLLERFINGPRFGGVACPEQSVTKLAAKSSRSIDISCSSKLALILALGLAHKPDIYSFLLYSVVTYYFLFPSRA